MAPEVPIQVAHVASGASKLFADAIAGKWPGTTNLRFDWKQAMPIEPGADDPRIHAGT